MKPKKYFPIYILILFAITVLYLFLAVKPLCKEYQFSPVWKINATNAATSNSNNAEKMYFRLNHTLGYFTEDGNISFNKFYDSKASASDMYFATYDSKAANIPFYDNNGNEKGIINASGFPFFVKDLIFVFLPGGASFAKCDDTGKIAWTFEGTLPITAFSAKENFTAVGFANGYIKIFDTKTGALQITYAPGGSDYPVILGLDISEDGQYIASISGHEQQRFVVSKRESNQQKIIYHKFINSNGPYRTLVHFCQDNNRVLYNYEGNLGIYNIEKESNKSLPIKDKIISIEESENLIYLLSKSNNKYTVSIIENTNAFEGDFSFTANSAFIRTKENNLYVGRDNSISLIKVTKE